jgi:rare lipoprotein A
MRLERTVSSIDRARAPSATSKFIRVTGALLAAATLAACAQSSVVSDRSALRGSGSGTSTATNQTRKAPREAISVARRDPQSGFASYYSEGARTASGERFDAMQLTAAHPTLPFGTRLRVTNVATGKSVTVRVNDRGPFVRGRVVDVSYSAAQSLGMVGRGVAKVKLDVVQ